MKTIEFKNLDFEVLVGILRAEAATVGTMSKSNLPSNDMEIEVEYMTKKIEETKKYLEETEQNENGWLETRFLAIRESGVEGGSLEYVKDRCNVLGTPVVTIKVLFDLCNGMVKSMVMKIR